MQLQRQPEEAIHARLQRQPHPHRRRRHDLRAIVCCFVLRVTLIVIVRAIVHVGGRPWLRRGKSALLLCPAADSETDQTTGKDPARATPQSRADQEAQSDPCCFSVALWRACCPLALLFDCSRAGGGISSFAWLWVGLPVGQSVARGSPKPTCAERKDAETQGERVRGAVPPASAPPVCSVGAREQSQFRDSPSKRQRRQT
jgi:hypothetical protein